MSRRIMRRKQRSRRKKVIIISTLCLLFVMAAGYAGFQTNLSITAKGNIKEKSRIIQSWAETSNEDFHTDYYRENIVSVTFLDDNSVPSNATESWDVSEDNKGGVMAYVVPNNEDNTKYDLYIGANNGVIANEFSNRLFYNFFNVKSIEFGENFDTSNVTNMDGMFFNCKNLITIDLSSFNTSNVISMNALFSMWDYRNEAIALTEINLSNWDTSNVTGMRDMFAYNTNLTTIIGLENFNTSKVYNMHGMFFNCQSLTELNLCSFDTQSIIPDLDSTLNTISVMFSGTKSLKKIKVSEKFTITSYLDFSTSGVSDVTLGEC